MSVTMTASMSASMSESTSPSMSAFMSASIKSKKPRWLQVEEKVATTWDDIVGNESVKKYAQKLPETKESRLILLGDSGTGKTMVARALANQLGWPLLIAKLNCTRNRREEIIAALEKKRRINLAQQKDDEETEEEEGKEGKDASREWYPDMAQVDSSFIEQKDFFLYKRVKRAFRYAKAHLPCILTFPEMEWYHGERTKRQVARQLLALDSLNKAGKKLIVIGLYSALPSTLDQSMMKNMSCLTMLQDLNIDQRVAVCESILKRAGWRVSPDVDLTWIAEFIGIHVNGGMIEEFLDLAISNAKQRKSLLLPPVKQQQQQLCQEDIIAAVESEYGYFLDYGLDAEKQRLAAIHEAGHLVACIKLPSFGDKPLRVSIMEREYERGILCAPNKRDGEECKTALEHSIMGLYAGSLAEELILGVRSDLSRLDIRPIQRCLSKMHQFGMLDFAPFYYGKSLTEQVRLCPEKLQKLTLYCQELQDKAKTLLQHNRKLLDKFVDVLLQKKTIYTWDIEAVLQSAS